MPFVINGMEVGMSHWATSPLNRNQITLFCPTLDDSLAADHPVRLFDDVLRGTSWQEWESMYVRVAGQPPIHPRVMAGAILYGLTLGIRSSRRVEDACMNRLDFIWLMQGRQVDHATICKFRTSFGPQLKDLFRRIGRIAIELGLVTLNLVTLDGTDLRADNSRYRTARRPSLERKLAALDAQIEAAMQQADQQDQAEDALLGEASAARLPRGLGDLQQRQGKLKEAMAKLEQLERERGTRKDLSPKGPAVPLTDSDSRVLPAKTGGYAPAYTSVLAVDADSGMILDSQVLGGNDEASTVLPAMENIERELGQKPAALAADSGFNSGPNLAGLEQMQVEALMPARQVFAENPALRSDPWQSVAPEHHDKLPVDPRNKILDKAAFVYDPAKDHYFCPMGRALNYRQDNAYNRGGTKGAYRIYQCADCSGCPLAGKCLPKNATSRRVCRDEFESLREQMARRLGSDQGKARYKRRSHAAETPFGVFKTVMSFRRFLHRGLAKVRLEQRWIDLAYNLMKLVRFKTKMIALKTTLLSPVAATAPP
jgi:transposase